MASALLARGVRANRAEEIVQDAWARLVAKSRAGSLERLELPGLAVTQAIHCSLDDARARSARPASSVDESVEALLLPDRSPDALSRGTAWLDDVQLESVELDVPTTTVDRRSRVLENADLERGESAPAEWFLAGGARAHYEAAVDRKVEHLGHKSARLEPRVEAPAGYGTMMQTFRAHDLHGKRLRVTAFVKGEGIDGRGDFWTRVQAADSPGDGAGLGGGGCRLSGTFDWKPCTVVFEVPSRADSIDVGVGLGAHGKLWLDDVTFEEVPATVPLTNGHAKRIADGSFESATDERMHRVEIWECFRANNKFPRNC